jgi:oxygen-dependent protoporphyrinogen oxidase
MWDLIVVGGGVSGLTAAYRAHQLSQSSAKPISCCLVESSNRLGGMVLSEQREDFLLEGGPDAFVTHKPWALDLVRELGLESRLLAPSGDNPSLYLLTGGRLQPLPAGLRLLVPTQPLPFLRSSLLSWPAKLRMLLEPFVRQGPSGEDISLGEFLRHRIGREATAKIAEPLLAHIHVADIERMSLAATYPRLQAMVQRHGTLRRGLRAMPPPGKTPPLWTLRGGVAELTQALGQHLPKDCIFLGQKATRLAEIDCEAEAGTPRYALELEGGTTLTAASVILALPAYAAAELVQPWAKRLGEQLRKIRYVPFATLSLGFRRQDLELPKGFGFFVPRPEVRSILAATFTSNKYPERAGAGKSLLRLFLGGPQGEALATLPDDELCTRAEEELATFLPSRGAPLLRRLHRWPKAYPQYDVGHLQRVESLEAEAPRGLFLAGGAFHGVGLPDCIKSGHQAAQNALDLIASPGISS